MKSQLHHLLFAILAVSIASTNGAERRRSSGLKGDAASASASAAAPSPTAVANYNDRHRSNVEILGIEIDDSFINQIWEFIRWLLGLDPSAPPPTEVTSNAPPPPSPAPITSTPAPVPTPPALSRCGCQSCGDTVWDTLVSGSSCGDRIRHLQTDEAWLYPTEEAACVRVANIEYPQACGPCDPSRCDGRTPPEPTRDSYCGCTETCTHDVWKSVADGNLLSCEAHVTWVQTHDADRTDEVSACQVVAENFPNSPCGHFCNPTTCPDDNSNNGNSSSTEAPPPPPPPSCGCDECTEEVLDRVANGHKCAARINHVRFELGYEEKEACRFVGDEYSDICGPCSCNNEGPEDDLTDGALGENVTIFDPTMSTGEIQQAFDDLFNQQVNEEMGQGRYSMFFLPGTYGSFSNPLQLKIGYYTEVAGLGTTPGDVTINGKIEVFNRCFEPDAYDSGKFKPATGESGLCFALNNFWRSLSNVLINIVHAPGTDDCRRTAMFWAISQASSMRRVEIRGGDVSLMDYCSDPAFASGGFIADVKHTGGKIINGAQQQFCARNMDIQEWEGAVWNSVFLGVNGAPIDTSYPNPPITSFAKNPLSREKPYLVWDDGEVYVQVPQLQAESSGISWASGTHGGDDGRKLPLLSFWVVRPTDSIPFINSVLVDGKHLLFTPGVYEVDQPIRIQRNDTVVLGIGHATLKATTDIVPLIVPDSPGIIIAGITLDAGSQVVSSPVLLQVGEQGNTDGGDPSNPISLHDVYFRVGGPYTGKADISLEINSNHVLVDHIWAWRADHGGVEEDFDDSDGFDGDNERWTTNIGRNGVVVNGNDVTATGLFVEHYQEYNVIWKGERGRVFFFQNELPYDPPTQNDWIASDGTLGWAGYKLDDSVDNHELWAGGVYCYNRNNPDIVTENGFEVPQGKPGIQFHRVYTRNLSGPGVIQHVINGVGDAVDASNEGPVYVVRYP